jgi:ATP-dependent DNA ligase
MLKYKVWHTVDCVVGGAYLTATGAIEYLLLGLYDREGRLNYVGRCQPDGAETEARVRSLLGRGGFTGNAPGGPSL